MGRVLWIAIGFVCASWITFVLAPKSEHPGVMYIIAGLVLLGGIAKASGFRPPF